MTRLLTVAALVALVAAILVAPTGGAYPVAGASATCGVERWAVKTLSDPRAGDVNFAPKATTVGALRSKTAPAIGFSTPRLEGVETTTYRVRAKLITYALEDDHDVHLVISSPTNSAKTMIVEFADPACPGARSSAKKSAMGHARAALIAACGAPSTSFHSLHCTATITGVGFFDVKHGQTGVAPNAIELHPVLSFTDASCSRP